MHVLARYFLASAMICGAMGLSSSPLAAACYKPILYDPQEVSKPKACAPPGKLVGKYCLTCRAEHILDITIKKCHSQCKIKYHWDPAKQKCCRYVPPVIQ